MLLGDNGIITKSTEAKFMTELSAAKEEFEMFKLQLAMGNNDFNENTLFIGQNSLDYEGKLEEESGSIKTVFVNTNDNHRKKMEVIKEKIGKF